MKNKRKAKRREKTEPWRRLRVTDLRGDAKRTYIERRKHNRRQESENG